MRKLRKLRWVISYLCLAALILTTSAGCEKKPADTPSVPTPEEKTQYVIAMDPVITLDDGTAVSARHEIASAISKDAAAKASSSLYNSTSWKWISRSSSDSLSWYQRSVRGLLPWRDGAMISAEKSPYSYFLTDDGISSLAVYDSSKIDVVGYSKNMVPDSGILMSFTGNEEEALCFTAGTDCVVTISDVNRGNIAAVQSISGRKTGTLSGDAPKGVVLRVYYNNRLLWQEVLGNAALLKNNVSAVKFPYISDISIAAGDSILITVQAVSSLEDDFKKGYFDIPGPEKTIETRKITIAKEVPKERKGQNNQDTKVGTVPVLKDGFIPFDIVIPAKASQEIRDIANDLKWRMNSVLGVDISVVSDDDSKVTDENRYIYLGETKFEPSKKAMDEIKKGRAANAADFILRLSGENTVVMAGVTRVGLQLAVDHFMSNYCKNENSAMPENLNYVSSAHNKLNDIKLAGKSITSYRIVTSRYASIMETLAAEYLTGEIAKLTGYMLENVRDNTTPAANEILIGDTNRTSSDYHLKATKTVSDNYKIELKNGKLIISGNGTAVNAAVMALASKFKTQSSLNEGYTQSGSYDKNYSLTGGYKLTWADEFNGDKLGKEWANFYKKIGGEYMFGATASRYPANTWLEDGAMVQRFNYDRSTNNFGAAGVETGGRMLFQYGIIELRVKFTLDPGTWSAFWTRGPVGKEFLEIDMYEMFGKPNSIAHNLHTWGQDGHVNIGGGIGTGGGTLAELSTTLDEPFGNAYHTVGVMWTPNEMRFFVDGRWTWVFDCSDPKYDSFKQPALVEISGSSGTVKNSDGWVTNMPLPPIKDGEDWEDFQYYDWVRLYQSDIPDTFYYNVAELN